MKRDIERIEADLYFERVDLTHWKVYVNEVNENSYWLICAKSMKEAIKRFKSFSVYTMRRASWVFSKEAR
jgi:hypothetical protein